MRKVEIVNPEVPEGHGNWLAIHFPNGNSFRVPIGGGSRETPSGVVSDDCVSLYCRVHQDVHFVVELVLRPDGSLAWHDTRPYDNVCRDSLVWELGLYENVAHYKKLRKALLAGKSDDDPASNAAWRYQYTSKCVMTRLTGAQRSVLKKLLADDIDIFGTGFLASEGIDWWINKYKTPSQKK